MKNKMRSKQNILLRKINNRVIFKFFSLVKLPMAFLSGLRIETLDSQECMVSVRYNYLTKNPFKSIYFACQSMAAELSSGMLCFRATEGHNVALLVVGVEAKYTKKAVGKINFTCSNGPQIQVSVLKALESGKGEAVTVKSVGVDEAGDIVSEFQFTWSFKKRRAK